MSGAPTQVTTKGPEQKLIFSSGRIGESGTSPDRYTSVTVYVYRYKGEPPSFIIEPGDQCRRLDVARRQVQHMRDAIAWVEANVLDVARRKR